VSKAERDQYVDGFKQKFKTEICKNWEVTGLCAFMDSVIANINIL